MSFGPDDLPDRVREDIEQARDRAEEQRDAQDDGTGTDTPRADRGSAGGGFAPAPGGGGSGGTDTGGGPDTAPLSGGGTDTGGDSSGGSAGGGFAPAPDVDPVVPDPDPAPAPDPAPDPEPSQPTGGGGVGGGFTPSPVVDPVSPDTGGAEGGSGGSGGRGSTDTSGSAGGSRSGSDTATQPEPSGDLSAPSDGGEAPSTAPPEPTTDPTTGSTQSEPSGTNGQQGFDPNAPDNFGNLNQQQLAQVADAARKSKEFSGADLKISTSQTQVSDIVPVAGASNTTIASETRLQVEDDAIQREQAEARGQQRERAQQAQEDFQRTMDQLRRNLETTSTPPTEQERERAEQAREDFQRTMEQLEINLESTPQRVPQGTRETNRQVIRELSGQRTAQQQEKVRAIAELEEQRADARQAAFLDANEDAIQELSAFRTAQQQTKQRRTETTPEQRSVEPVSGGLMSQAEGFGNALIGGAAQTIGEASSKVSSVGDTVLGPIDEEVGGRIASADASDKITESGTEGGLLDEKSATPGLLQGSLITELAGVSEQGLKKQSENFITQDINRYIETDEGGVPDAQESMAEQAIEGTAQNLVMIGNVPQLLSGAEQIADAADPGSLQTYAANPFTAAKTGTAVARDISAQGIRFASENPGSVAGIIGAGAVSAGAGAAGAGLSRSTLSLSGAKAALKAEFDPRVSIGGRGASKALSGVATPSRPSLGDLPGELPNTRITTEKRSGGTPLNINVNKDVTPDVGDLSGAVRNRFTSEPDAEITEPETLPFTDTPRQDLESMSAEERREVSEQMIEGLNEQAGPAGPTLNDVTGTADKASDRVQETLGRVREAARDVDGVPGSEGAATTTSDVFGRPQKSAEIPGALTEGAKSALMPIRKRRFAAADRLKEEGGVTGMFGGASDTTTADVFGRPFRTGQNFDPQQTIYRLRRGLGDLRTGLSDLTTAGAIVEADGNTQRDSTTADVFGRPFGGGIESVTRPLSSGWRRAG